MTLVIGRGVSLGLAGLLVAQSLGAATPYRSGDALPLREYVGREWPDELVHYDLTFDPGAFPGAVVKLAVRGGGELPVQLSGVRLHADGSLEAARVWTVVTLAPGARLDLVLAPGPPGVDSGLKVEERGGRLEVTTPRTGARFHLGEGTFDPPVPAAAVPAYLQAVRHRSGVWGGRGWFETPHPCRAYKVEVLERGPVFVTIGFRYAFDGYRGEGEDLYTGTVRIAANQEFIEIDEEFCLGDPAIYRLPAFHSRAEEIQWDWWTWNPHEAESNFAFSLFDGLRPTRARWYGHNATIPEKRTGPNPTMDFETDYPLDYSQDRFDISVNAHLRNCPDQAKSYMAWRAEDPASDVVGVIGVRAVDWLNPDMHPRPSNSYVGEGAVIRQVTDTADLRVYCLADPDLVVRAPLHLGRRAWGLLTLQMPAAGPTQDQLDADGKRMAYSFQTGPSQALVLQAKYGNRQLDKVKDWTLEWPTARPFPSLFTFDHRIEAVRARIMASAVLKRQLQPHIAVHRYLLQPNPEDALAALDELIDWCRSQIDILFEHGYCSHRGTNNNQYPWWLQEMSARYDLIMGMPELSDLQKQRLKAHFAFCAHMLQDDEFMPPRDRGYAWGSANMPVNTRGGRAVTAAVLSDNSDAGAWLDRALEYIDAFVEKDFGDDGTPLSCPHYTSTTADPLMNMALPLYYAGLIDPIQLRHPRIARFVEHLIDRQTPPDLRARGERLLPTIGHTRLEHDANLGKYAVLMSLTDRELAGRALWMWKRAGAATDGFMDGVYYLREDFPEVEPALASRVYPGFGAFLRNGFPHPDETYIAIHRGDFSVDHYDADVGSFHLYAKGAPLCLDFSSMYNPNGRQSLWHNTVSWNVEEHALQTPAYPRDDPRNFYFDKPWYETPYRPHALLEIAPDSQSESSRAEYGGTTIGQCLNPEADFLRTSSLLREFARYPFFNQAEGVPSPWAPYTRFAATRTERPYAWQRLFLFVKDQDLNGPNYLLVHDDFDGQEELTPQFNLWCLADDQTIGDNLVFWKGQYHVDLDLYVAWPKKARIDTRTWWHTESGPARPTMKDGRELQIAAHVKNQPGNGGFTALLYPRGRCELAPRYDSSSDGHAIAVEIGARTDVLFVGKAPATRRYRGVTCDGAVGLAKLHPESTVLVLSEPGRIEARQLELRAAMPAFVRVAGDGLTGRAQGPGRLTLSLGRAWAGRVLTLDGAAAETFAADGSVAVEIPPGGGALDVRLSKAPGS